VSWLLDLDLFYRPYPLSIDPRSLEQALMMQLERFMTLASRFDQMRHDYLRVWTFPTDTLHRLHIASAIPLVIDFPISSARSVARFRRMRLARTADKARTHTHMSVASDS